jgi:hypothetical protein
LTLERNMDDILIATAMVEFALGAYGWFRARLAR